MKAKTDLKVFTIRTDYRLIEDVDVPANWIRETFRIVAPSADKALNKAIEVSKSLEQGAEMGPTIHRLAEVIEGESVDGVVLK